MKVNLGYVALRLVSTTIIYLGVTALGGSDILAVGAILVWNFLITADRWPMVQRKG